MGEKSYILKSKGYPVDVFVNKVMRPDKLVECIFFPHKTLAEPIFWRNLIYTLAYCYIHMGICVFVCEIPIKQVLTTKNNVL